ncbi:hypothetical protein CEXT_770421 [Caerostris extrusa]|uniref:Uncharacterized protein n=1 Tax=Caerostris extrusa TaxID=172846 RepID=A0AAV4VJ59_CAEEX|nr:hypothetical protein CEXT_770421 [Caerostris extrusa]
MYVGRGPDCGIIRIGCRRLRFRYMSRSYPTNHHMLGVPHPSHSPDTAQADLKLFPKLKTMLSNVSKPQRRCFTSKINPPGQK